MSQSNLSVVILAAGQGTRMKSDTPKVLHRVLGRTLVGHVIENARAAGASRVCTVVGYARQQVQDAITSEHGGPDVCFAVQEEQKGTGHATSMARSELEGQAGYTLVLPGDVPGLSDQTLTAFAATALEQEAAVALLSARVDDPTGYGRILRDEAGSVVANVEHKDATEAQRAVDEINSGVYLFENAFLWGNLDRLDADNAQGEFYLPDLIALAVGDGLPVVAHVAEDPREIEGVNTRLQLARAESYGRRRRNEALMLEGVTMIDPDTTYVDLGVTVDPDVLLEPAVRLTGRTHVHSGAVVRQGSVVEDSVIHEDVLIKPYCHIEGATVRQAAQVGPFAHLRPDADIGYQAKVGNFVEVKKSTLGAGAKASHLSYIGDATVGAGSNIGAGTITCNYDGYDKHQTVLGEGVFTGSNSALVAPIKVGDNAYIGAGSTVTGDIPSDALAVARGRQKNFEGWVPRFKARKGKGTDKE